MSKSGNPLVPVLAVALIVAAVWFLIARQPAAVDSPASAGAETAQPASYATPELAARALYDAVTSGEVSAIYAVLGPGSAELIYSGDAVADRHTRERFLAAFDASLTIEMDGDDKALLLVGEQNFPFPYPLVRSRQHWQFGSRAGADEIINRRIGENELHAIALCLAYGDAQREYAEADRDADGIIEYAQKFRSGDGVRDGLYWPVAAAEPPSPLGGVVAEALAEGYALGEGEPAPLYGYRFRMLVSQGEAAPGGAYDYIVDGNQIGGYALMAVPAKWGASGVMTFMCNHDGVVYQKNLGDQTPAQAAGITRYNPDTTWQPVSN